MPSPRIMVLDEPTAALAPSLVGKVFDMVQKLPAAGVAVLMVEQRARQALPRNLAQQHIPACSARQLPMKASFPTPFCLSRPSNARATRT